MNVRESALQSVLDVLLVSRRKSTTYVSDSSALAGEGTKQSASTAPSSRHGRSNRPR